MGLDSATQNCLMSSVEKIANTLANIDSSLSSLNHLAIKLDNEESSEKEKRYKEMVNSLVDYICVGRDNKEVISILDDNGFSAAEIIHDLDFSESEVYQVLSEKAE